MNELRQVIEGGYCIGCGACHAATQGTVQIGMNREGLFQANADQADALPQEALSNALQACPFSSLGPNEDAIAQAHFGRLGNPDSRLGHVGDAYIGHVTEGDFRSGGTSGGLISWILSELLRTGRIHAAIHVRSIDHPEDGVLFRYGISRSGPEIQAHAKSRYYPVEMSHVLQTVRDTPGSYALVGLPCFIKAFRRLARFDPVLQERVKFCIGMVCGHLKSKAFADCFGWQVGIPPGQLEEADFRVKQPGRTASDYGVLLRGAGVDVTRPVRQFFGANWGYNFFRYPACDFCDDVFAETADMVVGDAWLADYEKDPLGNSIVVLRNQTLRELVHQARQENRLHLAPASPDLIAESQGGGLRDRREGLAYRLARRQLRGQWIPSKRIRPNATALPPQRARRYRLRSETGAASLRWWIKALDRQSLSWFISWMRIRFAAIEDCNRSWRYRFAHTGYRLLKAWWRTR